MKSTRGYLLDTNVISETRKPRREKKVMRFIASLDDSLLHLSVLTLGELRLGAASVATRDVERAASLDLWIDSVETAFGDRVLSVDAAIAQTWGRISADRSRPVVDTLLAATALHLGLTLVTRNTADVKGTGVAVFNPWSFQ